MKKIFNWTLGSFFRTIGRILCYLAFGALFALVLSKSNLTDLLPSLLGLTVVKAETMPYTSAWLDVNQCEAYCNVHGTNCIMDMDSCIWDTNNATGNSVHFGSNNGFLNKIEFNVKDSGDYNPGNYNLIINWGIDPRNLTRFNDNYIIRILANRNNSSYVEITSSCTTVLGSGNYDFNTSCNFSTLDKYDHFKISFAYVGAGCTFVTSDNSFYCPDLTLLPQLAVAMSFNRVNSFDFDDNPTNAINNQTTIIQNEFNSVNDNITDLKDSITDDSAPDTSALANSAGWLPAGPVDSILNLPLTLLNSINSALSGTCTPVVLTLPYVDEDLTLPCLSSIYTSIGAGSFINWIGNIAAAFILFKYLISLYKYVDDTLTFRENHYIDNWGGVD